MVRVLIALPLLALAACGGDAVGFEGVTHDATETEHSGNGRLAAADRASRRVEDVRATSLVVHSLSGAQLRLRGPVRQTPDGKSLRARSQVTESFQGRVAQREVVELIVAEGKVFVRGKGRWRRGQDTSPHFSYDEALALLGRMRHVRHLGARQYSGDLRFAGRTRFLEPLRLLDESGHYTVKAKVALDARNRVRRFEIAGGNAEDGVKANVRVRAFNEGLSVEAPSLSWSP